MITSIVITDCVAINLNSNKKFKVGEQTLSAEKEVPFVRYRFKEYSDKEFKYIEEMISKFNRSTHLIEIELNEKTKEVLNYITVNMPYLVKYVYTPVTDTEVESGKLSENCENYLEGIKEHNIDRFMLRDKSTTLDMVAYKKIAKSLKVFGLVEQNIGVCSSPLSFGTLACLTAVKARELMSVYSEVADVALPSANHQCMNCCGCIRYLVVDKDTEIVPDKKVGTKKTTTRTTSEKKKTSTTKDGSKKETKHKPKAKVSLQLGQYSL